MSAGGNQNYLMDIFCCRVQLSIYIYKPVEGSTVIGDCIAVVACVGHTVRVTEGVGFLVNTIPIEIYGGCRWTLRENF